MTVTRKIVIGVATGVLVCLLLVAGVVIGAATIGWRSAVRSGNEAATSKSLQTIGFVQKQYYATHGRKYGTFAELIGEQLLDARFKADAPVVDGYVYRLTINPTGANAQPMYAVTADPLDSSTGTKHFYGDSSSREIRVNPNQRAGPNDPPLDK